MITGKKKTGILIGLAVVAVPVTARAQLPGSRGVLLFLTHDGVAAVEGGDDKANPFSDRR